MTLIIGAIKSDIEDVNNIAVQNVYKKFYCENSEKKGTNDQIETKSTVLNFKTF